MNKLLRNRNVQIMIFTGFLMMVLLIRLFGLTILETQAWSNAANSLSIKSIFTSAPRGKILDRYGRVIATNQPSFTVMFSGGDLTDYEINKVAADLIAVLERNGDGYNDNFPIIIDDQGGFYYSYEKDIEDWLISEGMPTYFTAAQAFEELLLRNEISLLLDKYAAQEQLQTNYNVFPPISVKNMTFTKRLDLESFLGRFYLSLDLSAEEAFRALRNKFKIEDQVTDAEARKIMAVRNELSLQGYRQYLPAKIASGISSESIVILEEKSNSLPGVEVIAESVRMYPNGNAGSHVVGYLGKISENEKSYYVDEQGYNPNDMVGQYGIEKAMESTLRGGDGIKSVQVNALGELVKVIDEKEPYKGKDVYLTLDLKLQQSVEAYLKETLEKLQVGGTYQSQWGNYPMPTYKNANVGAVVVLDVKTGQVLAMASYPDYDPNLFSTGISSEDWASLQSKNPRDTMAPRPLFNVATKTPVQPGSTFKMVTATAALESGLDPQKKLYDGGAVFLGNRSYGCLIWNAGRGSHGGVNLAEALEVSCNYYFYDLGAGRDFVKGTSLGLNPEMNVERLSYFAKEYGLGLPTGIEISETVMPAPSEERKIAQVKGLLRNALIGRAEKYFTPEVVSNKDTLEKQISTIVGWAEENPSRTDLIERMNTVGIKEELAEEVADYCKFTFFNQARWSLGDELNISIGQGENAYTPLQMANYVATIGNKGIHNQVTLIKGIEGQGSTEKKEGRKINISDDSHLDDIIQGMRRVVTGPRGSLKILNSAPLPVAAKTGTAERAGKIPPLDEVEYIKTNLRRINSSLVWEDVEVEMKRLMKEYSKIFTSQNSAVRQAVINLSNGRVTPETIDFYKPAYDSFGWVVALAPVEEPEIAISVLLVQGGSSTYAGPLVRDIIYRYDELQTEYKNGNIN